VFQPGVHLKPGVLWDDQRQSFSGAVYSFIKPHVEAFDMIHYQPVRCSRCARWAYSYWQLVSGNQAALRFVCVDCARRCDVDCDHDLKEGGYNK
jgi:hypothetical protein